MNLEDERLTQIINQRTGLQLRSIFDLVKSPKSYRGAIPTLVECLERTDDPAVKEGLVRALSVTEARGVADEALVKEFRSVPPSPTANIVLKWAIANALSVTATDAVFADLVDLLKDRKNGKSREMLAVALGNMKNSRVDEILIKLLNDEEVAGHALMALGKLKVRKARPQVEAFLNHPKAWFRKEAKKALARMDK